MGHHVHGQHEGREDRLRETANWLGATPVDVLGEEIVLTPEKSLEQQAEEACDFIRISLRAGVSSVSVSERDPAVIDKIRQKLSAEELAKVRFG